jgi:DNA repair protein SbcC/Rad50
MKLLSLRGENFRSFASLELDLNVDGLVAVVGPNGAGKSTMFSAIDWALYGQRGRGSLPARRDRAAPGDSSWVEVEFEVGGRSYRVRRVDGKDAKLVDIATGEKLAGGRGDTARQVGVLLGLNREMFRGTFYARQKEVQALDSDSDARRREQVELLLGIERLRRAAERASTAAREQTRAVDALQSSAPDVDQLGDALKQAERDAQAHAPEVKAAEEAVVAAKQAREHATEALRSAQALEREHETRAAAHREAELTARAEVASRDALREQVAEAGAAAIELETLAPAASLVDELAAQERDADRERDNHERADRLRKSQRDALETAAALADRITKLEAELTALATADANGSPESSDTDPSELLANQLESVQGALDTTRADYEAVRDHRRAVEARIDELDTEIARRRRAHALNAQLAQLAGADADADSVLGRWHATQAKAGQLREAITHDTAHRDAVLSGDAEAACPTCKRPYAEGERTTIAAQFQADLDAACALLGQTERELSELATQRGAAEKRASNERALAAERQSLGDLSDVPGLQELEAELSECGEELNEITAEQGRLGEHQRTLEQRLPALRERLRAVRTQQRTISEARGDLANAESEAALFGAELATVPTNGYDPAAHAKLKRELAQARQASQRCAALRAKSDGIELLRRRFAEQDACAAHALAEEARLATALAEVPVDALAVPEAHESCEKANRAVDEAHEQLMLASRKASADSEVMAAARTRLQEAHRHQTQLGKEQAEQRMCHEVAEALAAYREGVSRRARPQLEQETALLLSQITRGRYSTVELSDGYQLQIADGPEVYPVRRFSGGEQDLAALCLRLALSRMLARQRGAETGFVLLDEVFGSQDPDRRRALLEQLLALAEREFRQVFVISHTEDVGEWCELSIRVARDNNDISTATGPQR